MGKIVDRSARTRLAAIGAFPTRRVLIPVEIAIMSA
jgi:hypothetical protein